MASWSAALRGDFRKHVGAIERAHKRAATTTVRRAGTVLKNAVRRDVKRAGLGAGIEKALQDRVFPARGVASDPAAEVFSKAIYKRPGGLVDLITVFKEGATIMARGLFLLIGKRSRNRTELRGKRLARAQVVKIIPRIAGIDAHPARIGATMPGNYAREFDRQLAREASR